MKPGRELNLLVAEKVLGWIPNGANAYVRKDNPNHMIGILISEFKPSNHIADAWIVVEGLKEKGFWIELEQVSTGDKFKCSFYDHAEHARTHSIIRETAPLAICMSALNAVGVKVNA